MGQRERERGGKKTVAAGVQHGKQAIYGKVSRTVASIGKVRDHYANAAFHKNFFSKIRMTQIDSCRRPAALSFADFFFVTL